MKRVIALIYWTFKKDSKQTTPYLSTVLIVVLLLIMHFFLVFFAFKLPGTILLPIKIDNKKLEIWTNTLLFFIPVLLLFFFVVREKDLKRYIFLDSEIKKGRRILIGYFILLFLALSFFALKSGVDEGTIGAVLRSAQYLQSCI
ncbi:MAG: hypothetical protein ABS85_13650 [Sphingobacteriales bacterium SCN 48-20]|jgi:hypothetical protein|uniref:hypothetical protein n=1 Tax=Terrimonas ferruginea TaxID=249 RepID=UPI00086DBC30|nr:hypothetical protein [Terrimonas ferruginea]MBN8784758.1 hypothetical protein [Terrimonas ferruginea]ODT91065.1 MAG: hypothetical protein ABS85_13650 [Sphingobacteriales bacterium SCN 48-20]OJW45581.1 MAG: hypothetical protein BGO56_00430 [Sphingobacteriales bacterium 48-107]